MTDAWRWVVAFILASQQEPESNGKKGIDKGNGGVLSNT